MKCKLYDVIVYDGAMDYLHGGGKVIREIAQAIAPCDVLVVITA